MKDKNGVALTVGARVVLEGRLIVTDAGTVNQRTFISMDDDGIVVPVSPEWLIHVNGSVKLPVEAA